MTGALWVVDLWGTGMPPRLVRWAASRSIRQGSRLRHGAAVALVGDAPFGGGMALECPPSVSLVTPAEVLSHGELRQVRELVFRESLEFVDGEGRERFPRPLNVNLLQLNLLDIQNHLCHYRVLAAAMEKLLVQSAIGSCRILSVDAGLAAGLHRRALECGTNVDMWSPFRFTGLVRRFASPLRRFNARQTGADDLAMRDAARQWLRGRGLEQRPARVLMMSESVPISEMFDSVGTHLAAADITPVVAVGFGGATKLGVHDPAFSCISLGQPGESRSLRKAAARWRGVQVTGAAVPEVDQGNGVGGESHWPMRRVLEVLSQQELDRQIAHLYVADATLEALRPGVVVVGNDRWWVGQAFVRLAREHGIPSLCVQDGVAGDVPPWWWLAADRIATTGPMLATMLAAHDVSPGRCVITGQPRYDRLTSLRRQEAREAARRALRLAPGECAVLFATQYSQDAGYVRAAVSAILAVPRVRLLLRPHPSEDTALHSRLVRADLSGRVSLHRQENVLDLLCATDVLVTRHSTVALEAASLGRPVVTADFGGPGDPYGQMGIATPVHSPQELTHVIEGIAAAGMGSEPTSGSPRESSALYEFLGPTDGRAGERVAAIIAEMLKQRPPAPLL